MEAAWRKMRLSVRTAIKLNRSHAIHGQIAYLLPCLGRLEESVQASGPQAVSMESSVSHFHGSRRKVKSTSPHLLSEPAVIAGIAKAALPDASLAPWDDWGGDYATVRDSIESTYPETFKQFNQRLFQPGGFPRPLPARERRWVMTSGKANSLIPTRLTLDLAISGEPAETLTLMTLRSNDQFNTFVAGYHDLFRGISGTRLVVFMNAADIARLGLGNGGAVDLTTALDEGVTRQVKFIRELDTMSRPGAAGPTSPKPIR